ncbi:MAG TPA: YhjD/YihY/BrkB family envelope integrity protein, partial [Planctomycetota bacterium]|nr:YhjD/YihY/BrkB family envelope integrity protein [Planctomycetota bacterium]
MKMPAVLKILKTTAQEWSNDKVPTLGAALAYYTIFSMAPLVVIAIGVAGLVVGKEAAAQGVTNAFEALIGKSGAEAVSTMIEHAQSSSGGVVATVVGVATLLFGASGVFAQLQDTLNAIWKVQAKPDAGWWSYLRARF